MATITEARRKIAAIDKRIDSVHRELLRGREPFDELSAHAWQRAWDSRPGLQDIERSLYARRGHWQKLRNIAETKAHEAAARRERRRLKARPFVQCEHCGNFYQLAA